MSDTATLRRSKRKISVNPLKPAPQYCFESEEESEPERPPKRARTQRQPRKSATSKKADTSPKQVKYEGGLEELPVELILEILGHLGTQELTNLFLLSRPFHIILAGHEDLWRAARDVEPATPPPPSDSFGEIRWALFLFGKGCQICGAQSEKLDKKTQHIYTMRVRACRNCMAKNLIRGADRPTIFKNTLPFTPASLLQFVIPIDKTLGGHFSLTETSWTAEGFYHTTEYYWRPHISAMSRRIAREFPEVFHAERNPQDDPAFVQFEVEQKSLIRKALEHAFACCRWEKAIISRARQARANAREAKRELKEERERDARSDYSSVDFEMADYEDNA